MSRRIAVRGIIVNKDKLFCVKLKAYNRETREDYWCTPGGGIDPGESLESALEREMIEETGIKPSIGSLLYIQQFKEKDTGKEQLEFFFHITNYEDYETIDLSKTSHGETEIEKFDFIDAQTHEVKPKFLTQELFNNLEKQPVKIFSYL